MNKKLIRLTEQDLHRIVKESVYRIINEDRYAWDLTDDGVDEFNMDSGYPTRDTAQRYDAVRDNDYIVSKIDKARRMGLDHASGNGWRQDMANNNPFAHNHLDNAKDYARRGKYYPMGYSTVYDINAKDDLDAFNKAERQKKVAADRRWNKAADSRPLYRKNSPNADIPR